MKKIIYVLSMFLFMNLGVLATNELDIDEFDFSEITLDDLDNLERDQSLTFSQKLDALYSILLFQAAKAKEHIIENKKAYVAGLILGATTTAALITALIIYLKRDTLFPAQTAT